jgi:hypothetical protein
MIHDILFLVSTGIYLGFGGVLGVVIAIGFLDCSEKLIKRALKSSDKVGGKEAA